MAKKQTYYVTIKGKKFDRGLIELADSSTSGKRDGRISIGDAKKLLNAVKDNNTYTDIEKKTMEYIRENYKFTDKADEWFRTEIRKWAAEKSSHSGKKNETEEYTTTDEAIGLVIPHASDLHEKNYSGYIPTPSAGQAKKHSGIPVLILSLIILAGFGVGIFYAFRNTLNQSSSSVAETSQNKKKKENIEEKVSAKEEKKDLVDSSEKKSGIFDFFSKKYEPASFSGKDADLAKKIQESAVVFEKNDISVHSSSRKTLDSLTFLLKKHADARALLVGFASTEGSEQVNLRVSQLRAEMVRDYLVGNGIESSRLILEGRGSARSSEKGDSNSSSEKNRRVDIQIIR